MDPGFDSLEVTSVVTTGKRSRVLTIVFTERRTY